MSAKTNSEPDAAPYHHGDLRAALITAAQAVLAERGLSGFTLRECARRAGVSHGAPAHHFGDAAGLLRATGAAGFEQLDAHMRAFQQRAGDDPIERHRATGLAYIDFAVAYPVLFQLMNRADPQPQASTDPPAPAGRGAFLRLADSLRAARPELTTLPEEALRAQLLLRWAVVHGLANLITEGQLDAHRNGLDQRAFAQRVGAMVLQQMHPDTIAAVPSEAALPTTKTGRGKHGA